MRLKGINAWAFGPGCPLKYALLMSKDAGFDGVELNLSAKGEIGMKTLNSNLEEIRQYASDIGIMIPSICTSLFWQYSLTSGFSERREYAKTVLWRQIDVAALLGAKYILCIPGAVGTDLKISELFWDADNLEFDVSSEVVDYETVYMGAIKVIKEASLYASERNVTLCIENVGNKFLLSPIEMRMFLEEIDADNVKAYFDVGNVYKMGYPWHWIHALGQRIAMVHFKDYKRFNNDAGRYVNLLSGDNDFSKINHALDDIGYDGWIIAEFMNSENPKELIWETSKSLDKILFQGDF